MLVLASNSLLLLTGCEKKKQRQLLKSGRIRKWSTVTTSCQLDDTEEYTSDGNWTAYEGPNQCNAGTGIVRGTWRLTAGGSKVIYTYSGYSVEYESNVDQLGVTSMVLVHAVGETHNTQVKITYTK